MSGDGRWTAVELAAVAAAAGAGARIAFALHQGGGVLLTVEAFTGAMLGIAAAGTTAWLDPALLDAGRTLFVVSGIAGTAGAIGTRVIDVLIAAALARINRN